MSGGMPGAPGKNGLVDGKPAGAIPGGAPGIPAGPGNIPGPATGGTPIGPAIGGTPTGGTPIGPGATGGMTTPPIGGGITPFTMLTGGVVSTSGSTGGAAHAVLIGLGGLATRSSGSIGLP